MKKGKLKKILATGAMGIMALAMPFALTGCDKDSDINVRVDGDYIQWQVEGEDSWTNLLTIDEVKDMLGDSFEGDTGAQGPQGLQGEQGEKGDQGLQGNPGINGREVEFRKTETHIQWRYVDDSQGEDENWEDLVLLSSLKGDEGEKGDPGKDLIAEQCVITYDFNFGDDSVGSEFITYLQEGMFNQEGFELSLDKSIFDRENLVLKYTQKYTKGNYFNLYDFGELGFGKYFDGWYYGGLKVDNLRVVAGNIELKAKWNTCITDMIRVKPISYYDTFDYDFNEDDLTVCVKPSEHYSDDAFISEFVFNDGKFYKVVDFNPYYNGEVVWNTITLPSTLSDTCLSNLFEYPNVDYMEIHYQGSFATGGIVGDYYITGLAYKQSLVYKLDWDKCEANLVYISGRFSTNGIDEDIRLQDFEVNKCGKVYDFKVVSLNDGRWLRPKYNFNQDTSKREMIIVLSDNVVNIGDINMAGWEYTEKIPCVLNIFIKNKNCIYELDLENYVSLGVNIKLYYYIENEEDVPDDGGNYWHYASNCFTPIIWENTTSE